MKIAEIFACRNSQQELLTVSNLRTVFQSQGKLIYAVKETGYQVERNQAVALIGMSGSGKSISILSIFGLVGSNPGVTCGQAWFKGENLLAGIENAVTQISRNSQIMDIRKDLSWERRFRQRARHYLGRDVGFVFQEPVLALDPFFTVGQQLSEMYLKHNTESNKNQARDKAIAALIQADIPSPEKVYFAYPHELSGGICQRVVILLALAGNPALLMADEPTTALDVVTQQEILRVLFREKEERQLSIMFITHDVRLLQEKFDKIAVLCDGYLVEWGRRDHFFNHTQSHPYTHMLFGRGTQLYLSGEDEERSWELGLMYQGCPLIADCPLKGDECALLPEFQEVEPEHFIRCWKL